MNNTNRKTAASQAPRKTGNWRDLKTGREWKATEAELREANRLLAKHRDIANGRRR